MSRLGKGTIVTGRLDDEELDRLEELSSAVNSQIWTSWWEGRDQLSGESFIMSGSEDTPRAERGPDIYLSIEGHSFSLAHQDLIAAARTALPLLIAEVRSLRQQLENGSR